MTSPGAGPGSGHGGRATVAGHIDGPDGDDAAGVERGDDGAPGFVEALRDDGAPGSAEPRRGNVVSPARPSAAPALRRGLELLHLLAGRPGPVSAGTLARELGLARSTTYELLTELARAGFAVHLHSERRWGLGLAAFEVGSAYLRGQPLERLAAPVLARLARLSESSTATAHLGVLHGAQTLYLAKERSLRGPSLVTQVGVRLPAALTATGLSILAALPAAQVRALFPGPDAFVDRTGRGVRTLPQLRSRLAAIRRRGWAVEDGEVSPDTASIAAPVFDHNARPIAAIGLTVPHRCPASGLSDAAERAPGGGGGTRGGGCGWELAEYSTVLRSATAALTTAIGGRPPG